MSTSTPALPPNPSLVALLLVIRSRAGQPRLVFHYPPSPSVSSTSQTAPPAHASWYGGASTGADGDESSTELTSDSDDDGSTKQSHTGSDTEREEDKRAKTNSLKSKRDGSKQHTATSVPHRSGRRGIDDELEGGSGDDEDDVDMSTGHHAGRLDNDLSGGYRPEWERVLGFDVDALSQLLTPSRTFNKRRFEIAIDNLVFLGSPMFVRADGKWKKRKGHGPSFKKRQGSEQTNGTDVASDPHQNAEQSIGESRRNPYSSDIDLISGFEAAYGHGLDPGAASALQSGAASEVASINETENQMTMFHVIFVMNPPALEYHVRVNDMYDHIVKRLAKYLKVEQARRNLVWEESIKILSMKEKAKDNSMCRVKFARPKLTEVQERLRSCSGRA
jgi:nitrogen permease regulator 3-like protein